MITREDMESIGFDVLAVSRDGGTLTFTRGGKMFSGDKLMIRVNATNPMTPNNTTVKIERIKPIPKDISKIRIDDLFELLYNGDCYTISRLSEILKNIEDGMYDNLIQPLHVDIEA